MCQVKGEEKESDDALQNEGRGVRKAIEEGQIGGRKKKSQILYGGGEILGPVCDQEGAIKPLGTCCAHRVLPSCL